MQHRNPSILDYVLSFAAYYMRPSQKKVQKKGHQQKSCKFIGKTLKIQEKRKIIRMYRLALVSTKHTPFLGDALIQYLFEKCAFL